MMAPKRLVRDIITVDDMNRPYLDWITDKSQEIYPILRAGNPDKFKTLLNGKLVELIFIQSSTRTYISFDAGAQKLGASITGLRSATEGATSKGESFGDTIDTFLGYDPYFIIVRHPNDGAAYWARIKAFRSYAFRVRDFTQKHRTFPLNFVMPYFFNGGSGSQAHPTQGVLDTSAFKHDFGKIEGLKFGVCNDLFSRVASSHIKLAKLLDWEFHFCPLPDESTQLSTRQLYWLRKGGANYTVWDDIREMMDKVDLLYVHRYQHNLRNEPGGQHAAKYFSEEHPQITRAFAEKWGKNIYHARPVNKADKEITDDLDEHPLNRCTVQSDFGLYTRMAMFMHAIENDLFSLTGMIRSMCPEKLGFYKKDLGHIPSSFVKDESFTTAHIERGWVIDAIPLGCGNVLTNAIYQLYPDVQIISSLNVKGESSDSVYKDQIKLHVPNNFRWTPELDMLVALYTDPKAKKSGRVSKFIDGKRIDKWTYRILEEPHDTCVNPQCITQATNLESIYFEHLIEKVEEQEVQICPFSETPQPGEGLTNLGL